MIYGVLVLLFLLALSVLPHPETIAILGMLALLWLVMTAEAFLG